MGAPGERPFAWDIDVYRFQLVPREWLGQEPHTIDPIPFLAPQISSTAELTYADVSREVEVAFAQEDLHEGIADNPRFALERAKQFLWSKGLDTSCPNAVFCGPKVATLGATITNKPTMAVQRGAITYLAAGVDLYQITDSATRTLDKSFANAITALVVWNGNLIVATGEANDLQFRASDVSGGAFTAVTGIKATDLVALGDVLWRSVPASSQIASADAITGTWASYDVGDTSYPITGLEGLDGSVLLIYKQDGAYAFDSDFVSIPLTPELRLQADAQVGKVHAVFNRDAFFSSRIGIVQLERGAGFKSVGLERLADGALPGTPRQTAPAAFATDGRFLYTLIVPTGVAGIYVYKRDLDGHWHNYLWRSDLGAGANLLFATGKLGATTVNAVLFAYQSGGNWQLAYGRFPATLDPTKDSAYQFDNDTTQRLHTLEAVSSFPTIEKKADRIKNIADNLTGARSVSIEAFADNDASRLLGTFTESPDDDATFNAIGHHRIALELSMKSDSVSTSQRIRAFHLSIQLLPTVVRKHTCYFLAEKSTPLLTGGRALGSAVAVVDRLRTFYADKATLKCQDEDGRKFSAFVADVSERTLWRKAGNEWESAKGIVVILKEQSTSG